MKSIKTLIGIALATTTLGGAVAAGVSLNNASNTKMEMAEAAVSKTVTRVYIEDQVNSNTTLLAIESISFSSGYGHTQWRSFLNSYLGSRSSYTTTAGSTQPSTKGWSYMSDSEQQKYLLCPSGSKNFTMVFPEWVTALSYKAVGNNFHNWFDVNSSAVELHSGWGIGKKVNSYIYNDNGWKMNANLDNTAQTNAWGDVTITAIAACDGSEIERKSITMSKYYIMSSQTYGNVWGYSSGGWYTNLACTSSHTSLITANTTAYCKQTMNKVAYIKGTMNSWSANDNYLMSVDVNHQYRASITFSANDEFKVNYTDNGDNWYGWSQVDGTSRVVTNGSIVQGTDPDNTGYRIKVKTAGTYEIYLKVDESSNKLWIQQDSVTEATTWAQAFLNATDSICSNGGTGANHLTALQGIWATQKSNFEAMTDGARGKMIVGTENATISDAHDRYVHIMTRYSGSLSAFGTWTVSSSNNVTPVSINNNHLIIAIVVISFAVIVSSTCLFYFLRKKKEN